MGTAVCVLHMKLLFLLVDIQTQCPSGFFVLERYKLVFALILRPREIQALWSKYCEVAGRRQTNYETGSYCCFNNSLSTRPSASSGFFFVIKRAFSFILFDRLSCTTNFMPDGQ